MSMYSSMNLIFIAHIIYKNLIHVHIHDGVLTCYSLRINFPMFQRKTSEHLCRIASRGAQVCQEKLHLSEEKAANVVGEITGTTL